MGEEELFIDTPNTVFIIDLLVAKGYKLIYATKGPTSRTLRIYGDRQVMYLTGLYDSEDNRISTVIRFILKYGRNNST